MGGARFESPAACACLLRLGVIAWLWTSVQVSAATAAEGAPEWGRDPYWCCGVNCLAVMAHFREIHVSVSSLELSLNPRENGNCSVADMERAAQALGLQPTSARVGWNTLPQVPSPCIVQLRSVTRYGAAGHYVILLGLHSKGVILLDPPNPGTIHPYDEFRSDWTGVVIAFPRDENERRDFAAVIDASPAWAQWTVRGSIVALSVVLAWLVANRRVFARRETIRAARAAG
jgi:ABC-type bacteriocin/lantibiotic exporter with double-glycine peptidase domain